MLNRVWKSGWHASIQLGEKCVYSTEQVEVSRNIDRAGSNANGIIPQINTANRDIQKNTRRIHSPESDISVRVPQDWKELDNLNSGAVLQAGCHERQVFLIVIKQYKHTFGAVLPLRDYAIATCQAALGWVADAKLTREPTHLPLGNYYLAEMEGLVGGSIVKYQITTHESAKVFYALYAWSTLDNYPAVCHELKQVSASLKVNLTAPVAQLSPA
ncbi:hypothetical protein [Simiduia aestuariiviva]|uniref:Uncharacterized protein n=1 Tax=Simiduia aestuariiviva TaxID=1510459 RepID=A0A839ULS4_9GAMM|nr:hypothetical protein [Simiduia aestuariiviva]MBB3168802.1 hypothetical protein [Simiduia aestuariiviva]